MWHVWETGEMERLFWWGKRPLGRPRSRWDNIKMDLQELEWEALTGLFWLRIGTGGGCL
jgi:hypothetical protein